MKLNYQKTTEQSIKKTALLSSTIIILLVATIIGFILIKTEYDNFKNHIKNFKNTLIEREKFYIKNSVENLKEDINFEEIFILDNKKQKIKNQSIIAYNLALSLLKKTNNLSIEKQIDFIKNSIKQIAQKNNDINFFILNTNGKLILNSENSKAEGSIFLDFEDINGVKFINEMINNTNEKQNFVEYFWYQPNSSITAKKITYSRHLKDLGLIIGSGSFLQTQNIELENKILKKISTHNYSTKEFILMYKINSLNKIITQSDLLVHKHLKPSIEELKAIKQLLINTNFNANDYIFYDNKQKLLYGVFIKHLRYFITVGIDLSDIYNIIEKERMISLNNMKDKLFKLFIIIFIITLIFFIFSFIFTKRIEKLFTRYKKIVKENEEKYALLFNYSNDGFIISEINKKNIRILSLNNSALKTIAYDLEEILYKDFFQLFDNLSLDDILESKSLFKTVKLFTKHKEIKTIELSTIIYEHDNKKLLFASLRDITERTLLKIEKQKQEKILIQKAKMAAMGEMIGDIAHQWRQPLSQVSGLFLDIESAYEYKELNKKYLSNRVNEANDLLEYMSKTIDDFRNFFNPNNKKEDFLIKDAVSNTFKIIDSTLKFYNINFNINIDKEYYILGYKNEYSQAILNIISNAKDVLIEKRISNPQINIYLEIKEKISLCIEDNAGGINKDIIDKIFDPYFTTKYEYGTGIGLYMTKLIIEDKMNGQILVSNTKYGARFVITI